MNNAMVGFTRFIKNKNFVTVILVIAALGLLFWGYTYTIKQETKPISIPVAAKQINPRTLITREDITYASVPEKMIKGDVVRNSIELLNEKNPKYTNINVTIPEGSMFYREWLTTADKVPGNWIELLDRDAGELGYYMSVSVSSTLGNSVLPDSYIDIYMKANDENGTVMIGKLLENVKVLVVHDGSGNDIFADASNIGSPSKIGFAVNQDLYLLLHKAEYLNLDLIIAPKGTTIPDKEGIVVKSSTLRDYIDAQTITVEEDAVVDETETKTNEIGGETKEN